MLRLVIAAALCTSLLCAPLGAADRPNVLIILLDDSDYEYLARPGNPAVYAPNLQQILAEGCVFSTGYTMQVCRPAIATLISGRFPDEHQIKNNDSPGQLDPTGTIAARLKDAGYNTFVGGKFWERTNGVIDPAPYGFCVTERVFGDPGDRFVRDGQEGFLAFITQQAELDQPWFALYAPLLPHLPTHDCPLAFRAAIDPGRIPIPNWIEPGDATAFRNDVHLYLANLAWLDSAIGQVLDHLDSSQVRENTLIVTVADNGWGYGVVSKQSPFEHGLRTHISFTLPGRIEPSERNDLVHVVDIAPTILSYAGVVIPRGYSGMSLRPTIEHGRPTRDMLFSNTYAYGTVAGVAGVNPRVSTVARSDRYKYVRFDLPIHAALHANLRWTSFYATFPSYAAGSELLFDLENDPYERSDLATHIAYHAILNSMRAAAESWNADRRSLRLAAP